MKDFIIRMNKRYKYNRIYKLTVLIILVSRVSMKRPVAYEDKMLCNKQQTTAFKTMFETVSPNKDMVLRMRYGEK